MSCVALGMKRALRWCEELMKDNHWNCTEVAGEFMLGRHVHKQCKLRIAKGLKETYDHRFVRNTLSHVTTQDKHITR